MKRRSFVAGNARTRLVAQEHPMGCSVACVASRCGISYRRAHRLFATAENAWGRGYYCEEIVDALAKAGFHYVFREFDRLLHAPLLSLEGTLVFIAPGPQYAAGHFLVRSKGGWMNPWANFPRMVPIVPAFQRALIGTPAYVIYEPVALKA